MGVKLGKSSEQQGPTGKLTTRDWSWKFWPLLPLYPYGQRRTLRTEVVKDTVWTFDQLQGILYVVVPIRMTVVKLAAGGLLVYAPIAPTRECMRLLQELVAAHGEVRYIILPTASGLEHKVFVGPFARQFPKAQVFIAPHQWSFPLNLPLAWLGFPPERTHPLPAHSQDAPFAAEFDYAQLGPIKLGLGQFEEVAFFHRRSRTVLVTDSVVSIPEDPPAIAQLDPYPLLFHARDTVFDPIRDTPELRCKGWQRIALFACYFRPSALDVVKTLPSLRDALKAPDRSRKAYWGWYPFQWQPDWQQSFQHLRGDGRLRVAPVLQTLILNRAPWETLAWANRVASWDMQRLIPCHLDAPIFATPQQFREAFAFLQPSAIPEGDRPVALLPNEDLELLQQIDKTLKRIGITPPAP
jgi:hypothetical protein